MLRPPLTLSPHCLIGLKATAVELRALDAYLPLSALPKNNDAEHDPMDRTPLESAAAEEGKEISRKELGRLKSKTAVAKAQLARPAGVAEEEPAAKRARSELDDDGVVMGDIP
jgi:hypothetical protein